MLVAAAIDLQTPLWMISSCVLMSKRPTRRAQAQARLGFPDWRPSCVVDAKGVVQEANGFLTDLFITHRLTKKGPGQRPGLGLRDELGPSRSRGGHQFC